MGKREIERCNGKGYRKVLLSKGGRNKERSLRNNEPQQNPKRISPQGRKQEYPHPVSVFRYREKRLALIQESEFSLLTTYNNKTKSKNKWKLKVKKKWRIRQKVQTRKWEASTRSRGKRFAPMIGKCAE